MAFAFWYEFASTYSYLAAMRVEREARAREVELRWEPFLLGPIFARQGWTTSPFELFPAKGANMWRDMERQCALYGLPLLRPETFPQNGLLASRVALLGREAGWIGAFTRAVYQAEFGEGRDISRPELIAGILRGLELDAEALLAEAGAAPVKAALRQQGALADERGIYGAPSFVTSDGELFWGNDRLEQALDWEVRHGRRAARP